MDDKFLKLKSIIRTILKICIIGTIIGQIIFLLFLVEPWYVHNYLLEVQRLYGEVVDYIDTKRHMQYLESLFLHDFNYESILLLQMENDLLITRYSSQLSTLTIILVSEFAFLSILSIKIKKYIKPKFR